ncbi:hypothetical protein ACLOJK_026046 [Asimina triloba]
MGQYNRSSDAPGLVLDEIITKVETTRVVEHLRLPVPKGSAAAKGEPVKEYAIIREQRQGKPEKKQVDEATEFIQHIHATVNSEPAATFVPFRRLPGGGYSAGTGSGPVSGTTNGAAATGVTPYRTVGWRQPGGVITYEDRPTSGWNKTNGGNGTGTTYDNPSGGGAKPNSGTTTDNPFTGWAQPSSGTASDNRFTGWAKPNRWTAYEDRSAGWPKTNSGDRPGGWAKPAYDDRSDGYTKPASEATYGDWPGSGGWAKPNSGTDGWTKPSSEATYGDRPLGDRSGGRTKPTGGTAYDDRYGGYTKPSSEPTYGDASGGRTRPSHGTTYTYNDRPAGGWNKPNPNSNGENGTGGWNKPNANGENGTGGWNRPGGNGIRPQPYYENFEPAIVSPRGTSDGRVIRPGRWHWNSSSPPNPEGSITKPTNNIEAVADYVKETARPAAAGRFAPLSSPSVIDSKEAARRYNGVAVETPPAASQIIDSGEAATKYHGKLIAN